jgi:hypothetical protein
VQGNARNSCSAAARDSPVFAAQEVAWSLQCWRRGLAWTAAGFNAVAAKFNGRLPPEKAATRSSHSNSLHSNSLAEERRFLEGLWASAICCNRRFAGLLHLRIDEALPPSSPAATIP